MYPSMDRFRVRMKPLAARRNKKQIERDAVDPARRPGPLSAAARETVRYAAERIAEARAGGKPVMLAFGAHTIKNGLGPALITMMERGWITLLATNGAGVIHDWEFSFQGRSSESVRDNAPGLSTNVAPSRRFDKACVCP